MEHNGDDEPHDYIISGFVPIECYNLFTFKALLNKLQVKKYLFVFCGLSSELRYCAPL
jgi:hypothetical protein